MVHYSPEILSAPPSLPSVCPKCGSHRTEVIGRSNNGKTLALRCNACGAHSEVTPDDEHRGGSDVTAELQAILAVGNALTLLQDAERRRVLQWAVERFNVVAAAEAQPAPVVGAPDPTLFVGNLGDLFGPPASAKGKPIEPVIAHEMLDDLFDDASPETEWLDDVFDDAPAVQVHVQIQVENTPRRASDEPALDVLVADFVSDFRRLAVECQTA